MSRRRKAVDVTLDQKPIREDETARVEAAGGRVFPWNGYRVQEACNIARCCTQSGGHPEEAASLLTKLELARKSTDNGTILVMDLTLKPDI
ncbi:hypothetical protein Mapa_000711 [Marchantia paleacea]|nr:hypothetical protein Mapa_000711 [Marchantia paleacea]